MPADRAPGSGQPRRYEGQTVMITGGAGGLGTALARRFAAEGANVALSDIDERGGAVASELSAAHGGLATFRQVDVRAGEQVQGWVAATQGRIEHLTDKDWSEVIDVHLSGTFRCIREVLPHMRRAAYGRIVSVSSIARRGNFGQANYAAAKAGIVAMARTVALEGAAHGITSNVVSPGPIDTPMLDAMKADVRDRMCARIPVGRTGSPDELAAAAAFLGAPEASFVTGVVVEVDGGLSVVMPLA